MPHRAAGQRTPPDVLVAEHRVLVDAIESGDVDLLLSRLERHMGDAVARITADIRAAARGDTALVG